MKLISRPFRNLASQWESSGLGYEVRRTAGAFAILMMIAFLLCQLLPDIQNRIVAFIEAIFQSADIMTETGEISAFALFTNNLQACLVSVFYGYIPFAYFTALSLGTNAMILGVMASYYVSNGYSMALYLASILPHGIFELPALVLGIACGLLLCRNVTERLMGKPDAQHFFPCASLITQTFLLLIIPLLAFAALTEAHLTPWVITLFS